MNILEVLFWRDDSLFKENPDALAQQRLGLLAAFFPPADILVYYLYQLQGDNFKLFGAHPSQKIAVLFQISHSLTNILHRGIEAAGKIREVGAFASPRSDYYVLKDCSRQLFSVVGKAVKRRINISSQEPAKFTCNFIVFQGQDLFLVRSCQLAKSEDDNGKHLSANSGF